MGNDCSISGSVDLEVTVNAGKTVNLPQYILSDYENYLSYDEVKKAYTDNTPLYFELPTVLKGDMEIFVESAEFEITAYSNDNDNYEYDYVEKTITLGDNLKVEGDKIVLTGISDIMGVDQEVYSNIYMQGTVQLGVRIGDKVFSISTLNYYG